MRTSSSDHGERAFCPGSSCASIKTHLAMRKRSTARLHSDPAANKQAVGPTEQGRRKDHHCSHCCYYYCHQVFFDYWL